MTSQPRTYVLIHGAWFGGWVWRDVAPRLRALGHQVWTPTLTGLGDRKHLGNAGYDVTTHINDIVAMIEMEDLRDIHLVGWSYGGMVATGVLARVTDRIRSVIYLDAFVPEDGQAMVDLMEPWIAPEVYKMQAANESMSPIPLEVMGLTDPAAVAFVAPRLTPQYWKTMTTPVTVIARPDIPFTYILCSRFDNPSFASSYEAFTKAGYATHVMDTGHVPMIDNVDETVALLANAQ